MIIDIINTKAKKKKNIRELRNYWTNGKLYVLYVFMTLGVSLERYGEIWIGWVLRKGKGFFDNFRGEEEKIVLNIR